jgi:hypothetical protein
VAARVPSSTDDLPNNDERTAPSATMIRARSIVTILYNGQQMQKYRSNAMTVIRNIE